MKVKDLIIKLLNTNMNAHVGLKTINQDADGIGRIHDIVDFDNTMVYDADEHCYYTHIMFEEGRFKPKPWIKVGSTFKCENCGYEVIADDVDDFRYCPYCGELKHKGESE